MTVLERLVSTGRRFPLLKLSIHIIEPGEMGCGVHRRDQPSYLLLNTVCGLPTMFPPRQHASDVEGESFMEWARKHANRSELSQSSYLPRALFGEYLTACFSQIVQHRTPNVEIFTHACDAISLRRDGLVECVKCSDGTTVRSRFVVLTTGHTRNSTSPDGGVHDAHEFLANLHEAKLEAGERIGVAGFGLSAFDVVVGLTVGRGGTFSIEAADNLHYQRSGREPQICMFSRSGLPYCSRPQADFGRFDYAPLIFDPDRVRRIRSEQGGKRMDFWSTLLPLLSLELRAAYCKKRLELSGRPISDTDWAELRTRGGTRVGAWVDEMERLLGTFDVAAFLGPCDVALDSGAAYQQGFIDLLEADLRESRLRLMHSVPKFVAEVLLHLRESFNAAVDFGGLDAASHDYFFGRFAGTIRRLAIGPQPERSAELVALIRAGVVNLGVGPDPCVKRRPGGGFEIISRNLDCPSLCLVERLILAQSPFPSLDHSASPLLIDLTREGRLRKHRDDVRFEGGVAIDTLHHPIGRSGQPEVSLFVLGPLCEGSIYYNTYVPTTVGLSRPFIEAQTVVDEILRDFRVAPPFLEGPEQEKGGHCVM
jgi:uncharacterized NAD(P)/FAD-binding protein YdhS